jgi:hypothetical protein
MSRSVAAAAYGMASSAASGAAQEFRKFVESVVSTMRQLAEQGQAPTATQHMLAPTLRTMSEQLRQDRAKENAGRRELGMPVLAQAAQSPIGETQRAPAPDGISPDGVPKAQNPSSVPPARRAR